MSSALPVRPDLDQLRRQAKDLLRAARRGDLDAVGRVRIHVRLRPGVAVTLAAAQLVIAREYGFAGWPALVAEVRSRTTGLVEQLAELVTASVRGHLDPAAARRRWIPRVTRLLAEHPGIAGSDIRLAAVLGEADHVRQLLARDPGLAVRPDDRAGWPPLLFACRSHWHHIDPARANGLVEVARLLLDAGADPNTAVGVSPRPGHCSALYAAAGLANHPALARLLLERGADPDTPAALYHTAFHPDHACLRLLLEHGARAEGIAALGAAISVADTEAVRLLLDAGVDPRHPIPADAFAEADDHQPPIPAVRAAIGHRCDADMIDLLLAHGADPDDAHDGDPSIYQLAARRGDTTITDALRRHGAHDNSTAVDQFLGACARADRTTVHALLDHHPDLTTRLPTQDYTLLVDAAEHLGAEPVALMLELGFPPNTPRDPDGATALHAAAYTGRTDVVELLIDHGANLNARDTHHHATPLAWASVGSGHPPRHHPHGDWIATIQTLLSAGAQPDGAWSTAKPPSDEAAALLLAHGIAPTDETTAAP